MALAESFGDIVENTDKLDEYKLALIFSPVEDRETRRNIGARLDTLGISLSSEHYIELLGNIDDIAHQGY